MRDSVVIDGVQLTRAQVEKAMEQLNVPAPTPIRMGDVIGGRDRSLAWIRAGDSWFHGDGGLAYPGDPDVIEHPNPNGLFVVGNFRNIVRFYREAKGL